MYSAINLGDRDKKKCPQESQSAKNLKTIKSLNKTIIHYNQSGTYLWAKGGGGAKDSHIICSAALESILNVDVATVNGGPWRKGTGGSVAYGWGTSKDRILCFKFSLNALRFSPMRETNKTMTSSKS